MAESAPKWSPPAFPVSSEALRQMGDAVPAGLSKATTNDIVERIANAAAGMSLRDYFAAKALEGLMANPRRYDYIAAKVMSGELSQEEASDKNARKVYMIADSMLKARQS